MDTEELKDSLENIKNLDTCDECRFDKTICDEYNDCPVITCIDIIHELENQRYER